MKTSSEKRKDFSEPERVENEPAPEHERAAPASTCIEWMPGDEIPYRLSFQIKVF